MRRLFIYRLIPILIFLGLSWGWWWALPVMPRARIELKTPEFQDDARSDGLYVMFAIDDTLITRPIRLFNDEESPFRRWSAIDGRLEDVISDGGIPAISPDGRWLVCWGQLDPDRTRAITVWDLGNFPATVCLCCSTPETEFPDCVVSNRLLAYKTRTDDGRKIVLLELPSAQKIATIDKPGYPFVFSRDGSLLAALEVTGKDREAVDQRFQVWEFEPRRRRSIMIARKVDVERLEFSPDNSFLLASGRDELKSDDDPAGPQDVAKIQHVHVLFDVDSGKELWRCKTAEHAEFLLNGDVAACRVDAPELDIFDARSRALRTQLVLPTISSGRSIEGKILAVDGARIAVTTEQFGGGVPIWKRAWAYVQRRLPMSEGDNWELCFRNIPNGNVFASKTYKATWLSAILSPDRRTLAVTDDDSFIDLYDIPPRKSMRWFLGGVGVIAVLVASAMWQVRRRFGKSIRLTGVGNHVNSGRPELSK